MATVPSETSEVSFTGNATWVDAAIPFPILEETDLVITLLLDGEVTPTAQVLGTHYTVDAAPSDAPTVTMVTAPPVDSTLHVERTVPITQLVNFLTSGPFSPSSHTKQLDKRTMVEQQLDRRIGVLEALANLVGVAAFDAQLVFFSFDSGTEVDDIWPVDMTVVVPDGEEITGVVVAKVLVDGASSELDLATEAITVRAWTYTPITATTGTLSIVRMTGIVPGWGYDVTLLLTTMTPTVT